MKKKKMNLMTHDESKDKSFGKRGTKKREKYERGFEAFKMGALPKHAREEKGLTQAEVARKCRTTKSYISKLENDIKKLEYPRFRKL